VRGLARAMDARQIRRADPEQLAWCLMGIGDFLGMRWVLWEDEAPDIDALTDAALALVRDGIARPNRRRVVGKRIRTRTRGATP
jgi:hypothetical protein